MKWKSRLILCLLNLFDIIWKCESDYHTKIHEALLRKKHTFSFDRQLYAERESFSASVVFILFYAGRS